MLISPSQKLLKILFEYDIENGKMIWKKRDNRWAELGVLSEPDIETFNKTHAGNEAGTLGDGGYKRIIIFNKPFLEHRLIWLYMTGLWPSEEMDHKNRIRDDNRWANLRDVTKSVNMKNKGLGKNNTTGYSGITLRENGKYRVRLTDNGIRKNLGEYYTLEEAVEKWNFYKEKFNYFDSDGKPTEYYVNTNNKFKETNAKN